MKHCLILLAVFALGIGGGGFVPHPSPEEGNDETPVCGSGDTLSGTNSAR